MIRIKPIYKTLKYYLENCPSYFIGRYNLRNGEITGVCSIYAAGPGFIPSTAQGSWSSAISDP